MRALFDVTDQELTSNDYAACQAITELVHRVPGRVGGVLQPSAAIHSEQTLVVFQERLDDHVKIVNEPIMTPPIRLFGLFELIIDTLPMRFRARCESSRRPSSASCGCRSFTRPRVSLRPTDGSQGLNITGTRAWSLRPRVARTALQRHQS